MNECTAEQVNPNAKTKTRTDEKKVFIYNVQAKTTKRRTMPNRSEWSRTNPTRQLNKDQALNTQRTGHR